MKLNLKVKVDESGTLVDKVFDDVETSVSGVTRDSLVSSADFDVATGLGHFVVNAGKSGRKDPALGETHVVYVKDEETGMEFPYVCTKGKAARMVVGIAKEGDDFYFETAKGQPKDKMVKVTPTSGTTEETNLEAILAKFTGKYVDGSVDRKNLIRLYLNNTMVGGKYKSYISEFIPVKIGTESKTFIIAPETGTKRSLVYFVDEEKKRSATLIDSENFGDLGAVEVRKITTDLKPGSKKVTVELFDGRRISDVEYTGAHANVIDELNAYERGFGDSYVVGRNNAPATKIDFSGINATFQDKKDKTKPEKPCCIVVGPETEFADAAHRQYIVYGADVERMNKLGLSQDEFICLLQRKNFGSVVYKADKKTGKAELQTSGKASKDVTGILADGIISAFMDKATNRLAVKEKRKNIVNRYFRNLGEFLGFKTMALKDSTGNPVTTPDGIQKLLTDLAASSAVEAFNIGKDKGGVFKANLGLNVNRALRIVQKGVAVAVAIALLTGVGYGIKAIANKVHDDKIAHQITEEQQMEAEFYKEVISPALASVKDAEAFAKSDALNKFVNESDRAVGFGREQANINSEGIDIAGKQLFDGSFDTQLGKVISGGFEAWPNDGYSYSYNVYTSRTEGTLSDEEKEAGYQLFEHDGKYYLVEQKTGYNFEANADEYQVEADERRPQDYKAVITTKTAELSKTDIIEIAHKTNPSYVIGDYAFDGYIGYATEGYFAQLGENAAKSALSKKSGDSVVFPVMNIDSEGNKTIVKFRELGMEKTIKDTCFDALVKDAGLDGTELTKEQRVKFEQDAKILAQFGLETFDAAYAAYIDKEYDGDKIHGSGVSDERDILASEAVQNAAKNVLKKLDISFSGVNIIPTDIKGVYYLQPTLANGGASEVIVRVQGLGSLQELADGLNKATKNNISVYSSAAEKYKSVYQNTDAFKGVYTLMGSEFEPGVKKRTDVIDKNGVTVSTYKTKAVKLIEDEEGNITFEEKDGYTVKCVGTMDDTKADIMSVYGLFSGEEHKKGKATFEGRGQYKIVDSEKTVTVQEGRVEGR